MQWKIAINYTLQHNEKTEKQKVRIMHITPEVS